MNRTDPFKERRPPGRYPPVIVVAGRIRCTKCSVVKLEDSFPISSKGKREGTCKACQLERSALHKRKHYERRLAIQREQSKSPVARASRSAWSKRERLNKTPGYIARSVVAYALRTGQLQRLPCQFCGTTSRVQAHHDDYQQPLNVMWLCQRHHAGRHAYLEYGENVPEHSPEARIEPEKKVYGNKSHCLRGHAYDDSNTRWRNGNRKCFACSKIHDMNRRAKNRLARTLA